jgi:PAS domain S-box-containing protein
MNMENQQIRDLDINGQEVASHVWLASIIHSSDDAIISKTLDGIVSSWNEGARRIFGYAAEEMIGQPIIRLIPPDRLQEEPLILERLKRGERVDHFETKRVTKDGVLLDISLSISPVRNKKGEIIGAS